MSKLYWGLATSAKLHNPYGTCFDAGGNMYIADALNNRIRKIDKVTGIISTFAGTIYFYILNATGIDGKTYKQHGTVTLIR